MFGESSPKESRVAQGMQYVVESSSYISRTYCVGMIWGQLGCYIVREDTEWDDYGNVGERRSRA